MKKFVVIMVLGLALLLMGLTLSASAVTILDNSNPSNEADLYQVFNTWLGTTFTSSGTASGVTGGLQGTYAASGTGTLSTDAGAGQTWVYSLSGAYATWAGFTQQPGTNPKDSTSATLLTIAGVFPTPSSANNYFDFGGITLTITTDGSGNFGFADKYTGSSNGTKYTQASLNSDGFNNGLIFAIDNNNFIVAFEDGDSAQPCGDKDYNDLVLFVHRDYRQIPLPPSALLLGSGLLGLVGLRRWRKNA